MDIINQNTIYDEPTNNLDHVNIALVKIISNLHKMEHLIMVSHNLDLYVNLKQRDFDR